MAALRNVSLDVLKRVRLRSPISRAPRSWSLSDRPENDLEDLNAFIKLAGKDKSLSKRTAGALTLIGERLKERQETSQK